MEELRDIRPIVEIPDISIYIFIGLSVFIVIVIAVIIYGIVHFFINKKRDKKRKIVLQRLKDIDFSNAKYAAYNISKYAAYLAKDERSLKILPQLIEKLEKYKYKKEVPDIDNETMKYYHLFLEVVDG